LRHCTGRPANKKGTFVVLFLLVILPKLKKQAVRNRIASRVPLALWRSGKIIELKAQYFQVKQPN